MRSYIYQSSQNIYKDSTYDADIYEAIPFTENLTLFRYCFYNSLTHNFLASKYNSAYVFGW